MRANSATVPKTCAWVFQNHKLQHDSTKIRAKHRPQMVQNGPKMTPQMSQMCPTWGQNGEDGPKMIKKGP